MNYLQLDPSRRIKWDGGMIYRDLWQWNFNPINYQCKSYSSAGVYIPSYDEPPSVAADLGILKAWEVTKGKNIIIAVADSGCNVGHIKLSNRIVGGVTINGTTNWNIDNNGHGTYVASIIAAQEEGDGMVGIAPESLLYIIKCNYNCRDIKGIVDASIAVNASILVIPWGFSEDDPLAKQAIIKAGEHGIIVVCSAMNQPIDEGSQPDYPIHWKLPNIIAVTSSTMNDVPYSWAAYSKDLIHLYAPGRLIIAAAKSGNGFIYTSGTSFAAPLVAGTIALIKSAFPNLTLEQRISRLLSSVDRLPQYLDKTITGGRLNVGWAIYGPKQTIILENGKPVIYFNGPINSLIEVEETLDFNTWTQLPLLQTDLLGLAKIYPIKNIGFYRSKLIVNY